MNTPSPLIPQGSLPSARGNPNVRIAVFVIIAIHAVFFAGILMQGCKRESNIPVVTADPAPANELPAFDTNYYRSFQELPPVSTEAPRVVETPQAPPAAPGASLGSLPPPTTFQSPPRVPALPAEPAGEAREYEIVARDTLWRIAQDHGVTVADLTRANPGIDPNRLRVGQRIQIPPKRQQSAQAESLPPGDGVIHVVKSGETLTKIARDYNTTISALKAANNLITDRLLVGDKLRVPPSPNSPAGAGSSEPERQSFSGSSSSYRDPLPAR